jgi:hypothetical protein
LVESTLWKWPCYQKQSTSSAQSLSKFQWHSAQKQKKATMKYTWKHWRPQIAKTVLSKKSNAGGITIPNFKLLQSHNENRQEDEWIRIEDPDINPLICSKLIFDKEAKTHDGEKTAFSTNVAGKTGYPHVEDWN